MTREEAWTIVLGDRTPADVVREFELTNPGPGLDEWLGTAEAEAVAMARGAFALDDLAPHHGAMLAELRLALA